MSAPERGLVGLYGGTFNPIHIGHLRAAEEVREALGLSQVRFIPSARPPHKGRAGEHIAPARQRFDWVRLAIADCPHFEADPIELEREGPSFLVETLRSFAERLAPKRPVFVLGRDAFQEIHTWREPETLLELAHFAVTTRPPAVGGGRIDEWLPESLLGPLDVAEDGLSASHSKSGSWIRLLEITPLEISASAIRERLRSGRSVRYLLPETAREEIVLSGCYAARPAAEECS